MIRNSKHLVRHRSYHSRQLPSNSHQKAASDVSAWKFRGSDRSVHISVCWVWPNNYHDPSARPQTEFLCKPIRRIMEEESIKRNHGGGLVGGAMIEKRSLRR